MRASASVEPPAGNGTMITICRAGKSCASTPGAAANTAVLRRTTPLQRRLMTVASVSRSETAGELRRNVCVFMRLLLDL
jgi:hypothetical protein